MSKESKKFTIGFQKTEEYQEIIDTLCNEVPPRKKGAFILSMYLYCKECGVLDSIINGISVVGNRKFVPEVVKPKEPVSNKPKKSSKRKTHKSVVIEEPEILEDSDVLPDFELLNDFM